MPNTSATGDQIVLEALSWVATPYVHQASTKGAGVDCVGLIRGVGGALGILDVSPEAWAPYRRYGRLPNPRRFMQAVDRFLVPAAEKVHGGVAVFAWDAGMPMHLGILDNAGGAWRLVHAFQHRDFCVHHGLTPDWESRIESLWTFPGHASEV